MRSAYFLITLGLMVLVTALSDVRAQSGSRGGRTRMAPRSSYGVPSRVGGARRKTIPSNARPTGMMNSANAARMGGGSRPGGSGSRPTTGYSSTSSFRGSSSSLPGGGARSGRPATGLSRPSRRSSRANSNGSIENSRTTLTSIPDGFRVWTDATGRYSIRGKLAAQREGTVWIRRVDGKIAQLSLTQLSQQDQQFVSDSSS